MDALIFDLDGVLVDVSQSYRLTIKQTVNFFSGNEPSDEEVQALKDKGGFNNDWILTEHLLRELGEEIPYEDIVAKFQEIYRGKDFDGLIQNERWLLKEEVLKELGNKYQLGILTGRPREETEYTLHISGMKDYFKICLTMDDTEEQKPDPSLLLRIKDELKCDKGTYAGDTVDDMKMAKNANFRAIGILPPGAPEGLKDVLTANGASIVLDDVNKLVEAGD